MITAVLLGQKTLKTLNWDYSVLTYPILEVHSMYYKRVY